MKKPKKTGFFENIFYWTWNWGEKRNEKAKKDSGELFIRVAAPEGSYFIIFASQMAYVLFFVALILHTLNEETVIMLYKNEMPLFAWCGILWLTWMTIQFIKYDESAYLILKEKYAKMTDMEKREKKKTYRIYNVVSILAGIVAVKLLLLYADRAEKLVSAISFVRC
jgi:hypothetical protein